MRLTCPRKPGHLLGAFVLVRFNATRRTDDAQITLHRGTDCFGPAGVRRRAKVSDLCRKHGMSDATLYRWKGRYGGMEVSELRRLKDLEAENFELKRLLADAMLDNADQDCGKKLLTPAHRRTAEPQ